MVKNILVLLVAVFIALPSAYAGEASETLYEGKGVKALFCA